MSRKTPPPTPEWMQQLASGYCEKAKIIEASEQAEPKKTSRKVAKAAPIREGAQSATRANLAFAIESYRPQYDSFFDRIELEVDGKIEPLSEEVSLELAFRIETSHGIKNVLTKAVVEVIKTLAYRNKFDSAREWGNNALANWDGIPRIHSLFAEYFGCEDTQFTKAVSEYFATAMAARLMTQNPEGEKADMIPILVGSQGLGKTTSVKALAPMPNTFVEVSFHRKEDDMARMIKGKLIGEIAELSGLKTREAGDIKAWVTRQKEVWIPKYSEHEKSVPRRIMFIGTTNDPEFLADKTGNRRWLPIKVVQQANVDALNQDLEQLWGEAIDTFNKRGILWQEAERLAEAEHDEYLVIDPWNSFVDAWLKSDQIQEGKTRYELGYCTAEDALINCLKFDAKALKKGDRRRAGDCLMACGLTIYKQKKIGGAPVWAYCIPPP